MVDFQLSKASVLKLLDEAGVTRRRRDVDKHIEEAARLYAEGWSVARIGKHFGIAGGTIHRHLKQRGVTMRRPWDHMSPPPLS